MKCDFPIELDIGYTLKCYKKMLEKIGTDMVKIFDSLKIKM